MGYWIVVAMMLVAVIAVVAAGVAEGEGGRRVRKPRPDKDRGLIWVALGASDATGEGTPDPARDNWVSRLAAELPPDVRLVNLGVSGSTLAGARRDQVPRAIEASPDVVSLWLVVNDALSGVPVAAYERDLAAVLASLSAVDCRVIVGNMPDLSRVPALGAAADRATLLRLTAEHWNATIARIAFAHGAEVVDLFDLGAAIDERWPEYFGLDGFHPSPAGHRRLAELFRPAIERALEAARYVEVDLSDGTATAEAVR